LQPARQVNALVLEARFGLIDRRSQGVTSRLDAGCTLVTLDP
jgi:hypothetical protein